MIYVDTGAFLARYLSADQYHRQAIHLWEKIERTRRPCFTSNFVVDETLTLLARRAGYPFAAERGRNLFSSEVLTVLRPGAEEELSALDFFEKFADQEISFTDCISFVLMERKKISEVFTFDRHFEAGGFRLFTGN